MSQTINGQMVLTAGYTQNPGTVGQTQINKLAAGPNGNNGAVLAAVNFLQGDTPGLDANGNLLVNSIYFFQGSIAGSGTKSIALYGGSDLDVDGVALAFTTLTAFLVAVITPAGGNGPDYVNYLKVGPRGVSNAWGGAWGGTGATVYQTVYNTYPWVGPKVGVSVSSSDLFIVNNPGSTAITTLIALFGGK